MYGKIDTPHTSSPDPPRARPICCGVALGEAPGQLPAWGRLSRLRRLLLYPAPAVPDLSQQGFDLVGGRLDVLDARQVAVLVYKRRQHVISVFIWPSEHPGIGPAEQRRGYNMVRWGAAGLSYWAVSDLNTSELRDFSVLLTSAQ